MEKVFKIRGKEVRVERIESILAVKPFISTAKSFEEVTSLLDPAARRTFEQLKTNYENNDDSFEKFSQAGWIFVSNQEEYSNKNITKSLRGNLESVQNVYRDDFGNIMIDSNNIAIKFDKKTRLKEIKNILDENALKIIRELKFAPNLFDVELSKDEDIIDKVNELNKHDNIIYAEPQMISHISQRLRPNDPFYKEQWHLNNNGNNGGTLGADISIEQAWNINQGRGVKIAIIDTGFDVNHSDIVQSIYQPSAGYFAPNGQFRNSLVGYPDNNHGTFCAGMALPRINHLGIVGPANEAEFIPIACLPVQIGKQSTLARSIAYAANPNLEVSNLTKDKGADVIACSLGPNGADWVMESVLEDAIYYATTKGRNGKGVPVFWAVSNGNYTIDGVDGTDQVSAYDRTISVGRSDKRDMENGSAYGKELDFLAPGVNVFSCKSGNRYGTSTGTSYATPLAAGVAALLLAKDPSLTWSQVRDKMRKSCDKIGGVTYDPSGHHPKYGYGRINAYESIK
ncbi:MAG: S8 family serine peptidase [Bacteroidota bacterium]